MDHSGTTTSKMSDIESVNPADEFININKIREAKLKIEQDALES
jgi:hypothetical protein